MDKTIEVSLHELLELGMKYWDEYTIIHFLISKGFDYEGGPICPRLSGTIVEEDDPCRDFIRFTQKL